MSVIYICGHLHPDSDSIASALALEEFYNRQERPVLAVRGGELNPETSWMLKRFKASAPPEIRDVRIQLRDVDYDHTLPVNAKAPIAQAWQSMTNADTKSLPVVDDEGTLVGMITSGDVARTDLNFDLKSERHIRLTNLVQALEGKVYGLEPEAFVLPMWILTSPENIRPGSMVFTDHLSGALIEDCISKGVPCIVECAPDGGTSAEQMEAWDRRYSELITLIQTDYDTFTAVRRAQVSMPVSSAMTALSITLFRETEFLDDVRQKMLTSRYRSYPVMNSRGDVLGLISRFHLLQPNRKKVILVDHNELSQAVRGLDQAEILGIVDHHRLGDIQTAGPIYVRNEPVGCTSTIIYGMFEEKQMKPSRRAAGLMLCAILSDTVVFKSPTCTPRDIEAARALADIAGVDMEELAQEMFSAETMLQGKTPYELLFMDFKEFFFGELKVGVSQIASGELNEMDKVLSEMPAVMADTLKPQRFDLMLFMATDIGREGTRLYYAGSETTVEELGRAFDVELDELSGHFFLPGVMSRKKQVIPRLADSLA